MGYRPANVAGNNNQPEDATVEEWLFNDAPRALRIEAVEKLPDLFENLIKEADVAIRKVKAQTISARQLAAALGDAANATNRHAQIARVSQCKYHVRRQGVQPSGTVAIRPISVYRFLAFWRVE
jgi:hypothetical protein